MKFRKWTFILSIVALGLFAITGSFVLVMQSQFGREKMLSLLTDALQKSGWKASIGESSGSLPGVVTIKDLVLESKSGDHISVKSLQAKLSLIYLLKREISFSKFYANGIEYIRSDSQSGFEDSGIPFAVSFSDLKLTNIHLPTIEKPFDIDGQIKLGRYYRTAFAKLSAHSPDATVKMTLYVRPSKRVQLTIDLDVPSFTAYNFDAKGNLHIYAKGPWSAFSNGDKGAIHGFVRGNLEIEQVASSLMQGPWTLISVFDRAPDKLIHLSNLSAKSDFATAAGTLTLDSNGNIADSSLLFTIADISNAQIPNLRGKVEAYLQTNGTQATLDIHSPELLMGNVSAQSVAAQIRAENKTNIWSGKLDLTADSLNQKWTARSDLIWQQEHSISIDNIDLQSESARLTGKLDILPEYLLVGELRAEIASLQNFDLPIYGAIDSTIRLKLDTDSHQMAEIDANATNLYYDDLQIAKAYLYADLTGTIEHPSGHAYAEVQRASWKTLFLETAALETSSEDNHWPTVLTMEGEWKDPLALQINGSWHYGPTLLSIDIEDFKGSLFAHPVSLSSPVSASIGPDSFNLGDLSISIGSANLLAHIDQKAEKVDAGLNLQRFPLDFLSINPLNVSVSGMINLDATYVQNQSVVSASLNAEILQLSLASICDQTPLTAQGSLQAQLTNNRINCLADLFVKSQPLFHLSVDLPIEFKAFPFQAKALFHSNALAELSFMGKVEELLDFFDLGPHRIEGDCECNMKLSNNLANPVIVGSCHLKNGYYENYSSGFQLQKISADIIGDHHTLILQSLSAQDSQNKGHFSLKGESNLIWRDQFPFHMEGEFSRLNVAQMPWMQAEAGGTIEIAGNIHAAHVNAQAAILESDLSIPERLPHQLPNLQVKYINAPHPIEVETEKPVHRYPIFLNLHVFAPGGIFVSGRGLSSEWKGNFQLGGTYTNVEAKGQLELMSGEFLFSGRSFKLTEGSLTFSGRPHEMPQINLAGRMNLQELEILARLKGPLDSPQLAFQSSPPLPMGSILSHLLFGQELSDINALQAAQIVNSLATFSGGPSKVFENTRRSLGIDRLRIIATPIGPDGGQSIALQVGKYVTRGVLVSVSQGPEGGTTNLSIEVDLTKGFVFQAESQQEQEQGKFTIKWNYNY